MNNFSPDHHWADALLGVRLASTAIEPWAIEVKSAKWRSITYPVLSVSSQPLLAGVTVRATIDRLMGMDLDHLALYGALVTSIFANVVHRTERSTGVVV